MIIRGEFDTRDVRAEFIYEGIVDGEPILVLLLESEGGRLELRFPAIECAASCAHAFAQYLDRRKIIAEVVR